jgi:hypothetical protein
MNVNLKKNIGKYFLQGDLRSPPQFQHLRTLSYNVNNDKKVMTQQNLPPSGLGRFLNSLMICDSSSMRSSIPDKASFKRSFCCSDIGI